MSKPKKQFQPQIQVKQLPHKLDVHYVRSGYFRTVHVDGIFGGPTPQNLLHLGIFSERTPFPRKITFQTSPLDDTRVAFGSELKREVAHGIERELEVDLIMSLKVAKSIHTWLGRKIEALEKTIQSQIKSDADRNSETETSARDQEDKPITAKPQEQNENE